MAESCFGKDLTKRKPGLRLVKLNAIWLAFSYDMNAETERVPCVQCGAQILKATSDLTGGICMPCFKKPQEEQMQAQFEADSKDRDLLDCGRRWFESEISHHYKQKALRKFEERYVPLLDFFRTHRLVRDPEFGVSVTDWHKFELRRSHLTELGIALFLKCEIGWLRGLDRGTKPSHMRRWSKTLQELSSQHSAL